MTIGILLGLAAAITQSLSYLLSQMFVVKYSGNSIRLLILSHFFMGWISLALLPFFWPEHLASPDRWIVPLFGAVCSYLTGQAALFLALKQSSASKVAPLLGVKIVILAGVSTLIFDRSYSQLQWWAVVLSVCAAAMLNQFGGRLKFRTIGLILLTCLGYCLSDISIKYLVGHFINLGLMRATVLSVCFCYLLMGIISTIILGGFRPKIQKSMWRSAAPYSLAWFASMLFLFACFASIGVVFGNIVQSTRGVVSIIIGALVFRMGWVHLETKKPTGVLLRRMIAAALMTAAIALFSLEV